MRWFSTRQPHGGLLRSPLISIVTLGLVLALAPACAREVDDLGDGDTSSAGTGTSTDTDTGAETETGGDTGAAECVGEMICNPLGDECPEGELCIFFNTEFQCFASTADGTGVAGAPCETATACEEGLACIQSVFFASCDGDACCAPNCDVSQDGSCPEGQICDLWFDDPSTDECYAKVGVCIVPP